ncbi:hypothetical protein OIU84_025475 [Salix udensis]|uniref:Uncharacterized protein n=1 Tax=Salix udensis TaxID=889485 RepID=A0AAD6KLX8_9ROSI|nr:hypothetical protein OIU84_025475 [Salix udensis]
MALATFSTSAFSLQSPSCHHQYHSNNFATASLRVAIPTSKLSATPSLSWTTTTSRFKRFRRIIALSSGGGDGGVGDGGNSGGGGGGNEDGDDAGSRNKNEAILALAEVGRSLESLPKDLAAAIEAGRVPGSIVSRLLADDLFLTKVAIECGVGIFTKTAAELERRREKFTKELDFVVADVVMAIIADFMLVWLPAPTVSLRPPLAVSAGHVAKFFYSCPDNAFQVALAGTSYSFAQRIGAIMRNGSKLFAVGTGASLIGVGITNALIKARKALDKSFAGEAEDVPVLSTSVAYGVYMAVSSNLRYQVLAGVIEQRILEPMLHQHKVALSAICFVVRTGNTFLGVTDVGGLCTLGWNPKGTRVECRDGKFGRDFSMAAAADGLMDIGERGFATEDAVVYLATRGHASNLDELGFYILRAKPQSLPVVSSQTAVASAALCREASKSYLCKNG